MARKLYKYIYDSLPEELVSLMEELGMENGESSEGNEALVIGPESGSNVALEQPENLAEFFQNSGEMSVCPEALKDPLFLQMVKNTMKKGGFINVDGMSGGQISDSENIKMVDHMSVGYYSDIIATDAFELGFNFVRVRNYMLNILTYFSYLNKGEIAFIPVDIEYGMNDSHMMVQIHANVQNFVKDYLWEALQPASHKAPFSSLVSDSLKQTDFLSVTYLQSASKVIFTASWAKKLPAENWFSSISLKDIQSFEERKDDLLERPRVKVVKTTIKMESDELPGSSAVILGGSEDNKKNLVKIKRVVEVIQKTKKSEGVDPEEVTQDDIDALINNMKPEVVEDLSDDEKSYIADAVKDPKELKKIDAGIDRVLDSFDDEKYVDLFSESIEDMSADDVNSYLKKNEDEDDKVTDEVWQVKKLKIVDDLKANSEEIKKSGGGRTELNAEVLKLVSQELEAIEDDCAPMVDDLADKVTEQMIAEKIENSGGDVQAMALEHSREVQGLKNQVASANERANRMKKLIDIMKSQIASMAAVESKLKTLGEGDNLDKANPDEQINYLKIQLKNALNDAKAKDIEMRKMADAVTVQPGQAPAPTIDEAAVEEQVKDIEETLDAVGNDSDNIEEQLNKKILYLKNALDSQIRETKNRDSTIEKIRASNEKIVEQKEKEIEKLKNRPTMGAGAQTNVGGDAQSVDGEGANAAELQEENQNLKTQLETMKNRLSQLNENMETKTKQITKKMEAGMMKLIQEGQKSTSTINKLREEKERVNRLLKKSQQSSSMLEEEVRLLKIEANQRQEDKKEKATSNVAEAGKIKELQDREKQFTEKLKTAGLKIKSYEQKIKFMQAQVNAAQGGGAGGKKNAGARGKAGAGGNDQKFQLKIKQLKTLKGKAEEASKKAQADLNSVKKDNVQLKQELNATKLKLEELERKANKKAS